MAYEPGIRFCVKHNRIVTHAYAQARVMLGKTNCFDGCKHLKVLREEKVQKLLKKRRES